jgi:hypothetical protein
MAVADKNACCSPPAVRCDTVHKQMEFFSEWLSAYYGLPSAGHRPTIEFASNETLEHLRRAALFDGNDESLRTDAKESRQLVAIYDGQTRTIFLPQNWTGTTLAEQSMLLHELTHHFQILAGLQYECPAAREKLAYLAQAKWLADSDEAGHAFQFEAGRVFRSEAGHPWRRSHGSIS